MKTALFLLNPRSDIHTYAHVLSSKLLFSLMLLSLLVPISNLQITTRTATNHLAAAAAAPCIGINNENTEHGPFRLSFLCLLSAVEVLLEVTTEDNVDQVFCQMLPTHPYTLGKNLMTQFLKEHKFDDNVYHFLSRNDKHLSAVSTFLCSFHFMTSWNLYYNHLYNVLLVTTLLSIILGSFRNYSCIFPMTLLISFPSTAACACLAAQA